MRPLLTNYPLQLKLCISENHCHLLAIVMRASKLVDASAKIDNSKQTKLQLLSIAQRLATRTHAHTQTPQAGAGKPVAWLNAPLMLARWPNPVKLRPALRLDQTEVAPNRDRD